MRTTAAPTIILAFSVLSLSDCDGDDVAVYGGYLARRDGVDDGDAAPGGYGTNVLIANASALSTSLCGLGGPPNYWFLSSGAALTVQEHRRRRKSHRQELVLDFASAASTPDVEVVIQVPGCATSHETPFSRLPAGQMRRAPSSSVWGDGMPPAFTSHDFT